MNKIIRNILIFSVAFTTITPFAVLRAIETSSASAIELTADPCDGESTTVNGNTNDCQNFSLDLFISNNLDELRRNLVPEKTSFTLETTSLSAYDNENVVINIQQRVEGNFFTTESYKMFTFFFNLNTKEAKAKQSTHFNYTGTANIKYYPKYIYKLENGAFMSFEETTNSTLAQVKYTPNIETLDYDREVLFETNLNYMDNYNFASFGIDNEIFLFESSTNQKPKASKLYRASNFGAPITLFADVSSHGLLANNTKWSNNLSIVTDLEDYVYVVPSITQGVNTLCETPYQQTKTFMRIDRTTKNLEALTQPYEDCELFPNTYSSADGNIWSLTSNMIAYNAMVDKYTPETNVFESINIGTGRIMDRQNVSKADGTNFFIVEEGWHSDFGLPSRTVVLKVDSSNRSKELYSSTPDGGAYTEMPFINTQKDYTIVGDKFVFQTRDGANDDQKGGIFNLATISFNEIVEKPEEGDTLPSYSSVCELKTKTQAYAEFAGRVFEARVNPNNNKRILIRSTSDGVFGGINQTTGEVDLNEEWVNLPGYQRRKIINVGFFVKDTKMFMFAKGRLNGTNKIFFRVIREDLSMSGWKEATTTTQKNRAKKAFTCAY